MEKEIVTVTEINGTDITYDGSMYFNGCDVRNFPDKPEVGKKYVLIHDWKNASTSIVSYSENP
jgi:hypothetical protein